MKRTGILLLAGLLLAPVAASAELIRAYIFIRDGQLTSARNAIQGSALDAAGGWANEFGVDLERAGGGGPGWNGAAWTMERNCVNPGTCDAVNETVSFELFVKDVIQELGMQWNTGASNVQVVTYVRSLSTFEAGDDYLPTDQDFASFVASLNDLVKKPWAFVEVDPGGPV